MLAAVGSVLGFLFFGVGFQSYSTIGALELFAVLILLFEQPNVFRLVHSFSSTML